MNCVLNTTNCIYSLLSALLIKHLFNWRRLLSKYVSGIFRSEAPLQVTLSLCLSVCRQLVFLCMTILYIIHNDSLPFWKMTKSFNLRGNPLHSAKGGGGSCPLGKCEFLWEIFLNALNVLKCKSVQRTFYKFL